MSKLNKAIAALGIVAGLGVAALPLSSYAADLKTVSQNLTVQAYIEETISITIAEGSEGSFTDKGASTDAILDLGNVALGSYATGDVDVKVMTNSDSGYTLTLASATDSTTMTNGKTGTINAIASGAIESSSTSAWGYKVGSGNWTGVVANNSDSKPTIDSSTAPTDGESTGVTNVTFGVAASSTQESGTYTASVVFTATSNNQ